MEIVLTLPELHEGQELVKKESKRFTVVNCGRRWGKTFLGIDLLIDPALDGFPVAFFSPTYKMLSETWNETKNLTFPITKGKDEQLKQIQLITGGIIDFWSLDNIESIRGRKYKRVIIDEFAILPNDKARRAWLEVIRPLLTDYRGDAYFLSTPKGINSYFYELFNNEEKYGDWKSFKMPTSSNPYIDKEELKEAEAQLDPLTFKQEYLAEFTTTLDKPFMYCFEDRHIKEVEFNPKDTVYLSFDFNVDPITCTAWQLGRDFIHGLFEFRLRNSNLYELCDTIKSTLGKCHILITGDASGFNRTVTTKGNVNNYTIILKELGIGAPQLKVPRSNPPISESRTLCNSIFARHPNVYLHPRMKYLIQDNRFVQVKDDGAIDKTKDAHMGHLLDTERYLFNSFKHDFIQKQR